VGINKGLAEYLGGDTCWDIARIMRLPETTNFPTKKKREAGRTEALTCFIDYMDGPLYNPLDFEDFYRADVSKRGEEEKLMITADIPERFSIDLEKNKYLAELWSGIRVTLRKGTKEIDRSRMDWFLAQQLLKYELGKARERTSPEKYIQGVILDARSRIKVVAENKFEFQANRESKTSETILAENGSAILVSKNWEMIIPLNEHELPNFPTEDFPPLLHKMIQELSESIDVQPELVALVLLGVVSACVTGKYICKVSEVYCEPIHIWTCIALESGNRKSAVLNLLTKPILDYENRVNQEIIPEVIKAKSIRKSQEKIIEKKRNKLKNFEDSQNELREISDLEMNLQAIPTQFRVLADDVTQEKLAILMSENAGAI
jgi:hypothetical protein